MLIKQQSFAFLGILQVYWKKLSLCIFSCKAQKYNLQKLYLQAVKKYKADFHKM